MSEFRILNDSAGKSESQPESHAKSGIRRFSAVFPVNNSAKMRFYEEKCGFFASLALFLFDFAKKSRLNFPCKGRNA